MTSVAEDLEVVRQASSRVMASVAALDEASLRAPSLLPGWTRAHVAVHLARNADAQVRMIAGALRGESVEQYPGGEQGREQEIAAGVAASSSEIVNGLRRSIDALDHQWAALPHDAWDLETVTLRFRRTIREGVNARWREVEIHHADLGCDYGPSDWPREFVDRFLDRTISRLPSRLGAADRIVRWQFVDQDGARSWLVDNEVVRGGDDQAEVVVTGAGWQLLAWLCGRGDHGLDVTGKADHLPELPSYG